VTNGRFRICDPVGTTFADHHTEGLPPGAKNDILLEVLADAIEYASAIFNRRRRKRRIRSNRAPPVDPARASAAAFGVGPSTTIRHANA